MPSTLIYNASQSYTIPSDVASIRVRMWGSGGGGEFIAQDAFFTSTAGSNGENTSFIGIVANGGQGGGQGGKNLGGAGGTTSLSYAWDTLRGVTFTRTNGSNGQLTAGGLGVDISGYTRRDGGAGTEGTTTYNSTVTHQFDNSSNTHILQQSSPDITVSFEGAGAADSLPCGYESLGYKHYAISFNQPFLNNTYTISVTSVTQQAAGGGVGGSFIVSPDPNNSVYKSQYGFRIWFCRCNPTCYNSYVRGFSFSATGIKPAQRGLGGGGGSYITGTITRAQFQASGTYAPGTTHNITIGSGGARGGNTSNTGTNGFVELYVLIVPNVTVTLDSSAITRGSSTVLRWFTSGDADTASVNPGLATANVNGNLSVNPVVTTTYTVSVSGLGGSDSKTVTLVVYQPPTATIDAPTTLDYGVQGNVNYTASYANSTITVIPTYVYDVVGTVTGTSITLPACSSAEFGATGSSVSGSFTTAIPYNTRGPRSVTYTMTATGSGGSVEVYDSITINIDETPDSVVIPETDGVFKDQDPVYTPDGTVLSEVIQINDIDIPVEIKSANPIQVRFNNDTTWYNLRQIT